MSDDLTAIRDAAARYRAETCLADTISGGCMRLKGHPGAHSRPEEVRIRVEGYEMFGNRVGLAVELGLTEPGTPIEYADETAPTCPKTHAGGDCLLEMGHGGPHEAKSGMQWGWPGSSTPERPIPPRRRADLYAALCTLERNAQQLAIQAGDLERRLRAIHEAARETRQLLEGIK